MTHEAGSSHVGSWLSMAEILAVLYGETLRVDPARAYTRCWPSKDSSLPVAQWGSRLQCPDSDVTVAPELSVNAGETDKRFRVLKLGAAGSAMSFAPTRVVKRDQSYA